MHIPLGWSWGEKILWEDEASCFEQCCICVHVGLSLCVWKRLLRKLSLHLPAIYWLKQHSSLEIRIQSLVLRPTSICSDARSELATSGYVIVIEGIELQSGRIADRCCCWCSERLLALRLLLNIEFCGFCGLLQLEFKNLWMLNERWDLYKIRKIERWEYGVLWFLWVVAVGVQEFTTVEWTLSDGLIQN